MKAWQQRTILYTVLVLAATTMIGLKANIPFFMQMTSSLGISNTAFVEEVIPIDNLNSVRVKSNQ